MRRLIVTTLLMTASLAVFSGLGQAQPDRFNPRWVSGLVDRVHRDLNHAYEGFRFNEGDRRRLDRAEHELREFSKQWDRGRFDKGRIDESIESIQHAVDRNHMRSRDRDALFDDLRQLRNMREAFDRHEIRERR